MRWKIVSMFEADGTLHEVPGAIANCKRCNGKGRVVDPAFAVWTEEDRAADPEMFEATQRGENDIGCPDCQGTGERIIPDPTIVPDNIWKLYLEVVAAEERDERERANDIRRGY